MSDLISRKALLNDFRKTITEQSGTMDWLNMINRQPSVGNNRWIPVSERLPDDRFNKSGEPIEYSVMLRRATEPTTLSIDEHGKWFDRRGYYYNIASLMAYEFDVIAWQPLPEPWKEM